MVQNFSHRLKDAFKQFFGPPFDMLREPVESAGLKAICHQSWPDDQKLIAAWEELRALVPTATTFHTPGWQKAVVETLAKKDRLRLIVVYRGAELVGVVPMHMRDDGLLESLGPSVTDYLDPLIHPDHEAEVWRIVLKLFSKLREGKWKNVTLHYVRDGAACRTILPRLAAEEGFTFEEKIPEYCPCLNLPKTWDGFLATFDSHERKETKRKINKVMTKGAGKVVRCGRDPGEIASSLGHCFRLMEMAAGAKGEDVKRTLRPLLEKSAPGLIASGALWLTTLVVNDEPAACILQFPHPKGPQLYNCGFDPGKKEWSPGVVLVAVAIQRAIEEGYETFDLLRGQEAYKYKLGAFDRPLWMINLKKA